MTEQELKAKWLDQLLIIDNCQRTIQQLKDEIIKLQADVKHPSVVTNDTKPQ